MSSGDHKETSRKKKRRKTSHENASKKNRACTLNAYQQIWSDQKLFFLTPFILCARLKNLDLLEKKTTLYHSHNHETLGWLTTGSWIDPHCTASFYLGSRVKTSLPGNKSVISKNQRTGSWSVVQMDPRSNLQSWLAQVASLFLCCAMRVFSCLFITSIVLTDRGLFLLFIVGSRPTVLILACGDVSIGSWGWKTCSQKLIWPLWPLITIAWLVSKIRVGDKGRTSQPKPARRVVVITTFGGSHPLPWFCNWRATLLLFGCHCGANIGITNPIDPIYFPDLTKSTCEMLVVIGKDKPYSVRISSSASCFFCVSDLLTRFYAKT